MTFGFIRFFYFDLCLFFREGHSFQRDPFRFFREKWENQNVDDNIQKLFGVPDIFQGTFIHMSSYAPYELGIQEGIHETCLDALKKGEHHFEDLVCDWLHLNYSEKMSFDDPLGDLEEELKPSLISCFEKYKKMSSFPSENIGSFWQELADLLTPHTKILKLNLRGKKEESRRKADINRICEYFDLPYFLPNSENKTLTLIDKDEGSNNQTSVAQYADIKNKSSDIES